MIAKVIFISLLLFVSAQRQLVRVPPACSVPKSPPTCMYLQATPYFKTCGIYNGGNCPRFCHSLQAQYWARQKVRSRRCFKFNPSLIESRRIYAFCMYRCAYAKRKIRRYRVDGLKKVGPCAAEFGWKTSKIKALMYISLNRRGFVKSRVLVHTSNPTVQVVTNKHGDRECRGVHADYSARVCANCRHYRAVCPRNCRYEGYFWV